MGRLVPRQPVPALEVPLAGGGDWALGRARPEHFSMVAFYRGLHCPICKGWLGGLEKLADSFRAKGVDFVAVSMDSAERAEKSKADWALAEVPIGYGMGRQTAADWGLYFSSKRDGSTEPDLFSEPGLFLVRPDGTLYFGAVQTMPFTRPAFHDVLNGIDYVIKNDYPARGELG